MSRRASTSRRRRGLTLLEVLAAVALLGILYTYLAKAASQGILTAGESRWRMEASLIADEALVALDREMALGVPLELGQTQTVAEPYTITRTTRVFEPPPELLAIAQGEDPDAAAAGLSLLVGGPNAPGILRVVEIQVDWFDGIADQSLRRIAVAYDAAAALALFGLAPGLAEGDDG